MGFKKFVLRVVARGEASRENTTTHGRIASSKSPVVVVVPGPRGKLIVDQEFLPLSSQMTIHVQLEFHKASESIGSERNLKRLKKIREG